MSNNIFIKIFRFYYDGFRGMTVGKKLWIIILIKLFVFFAVSYTHLTLPTSDLV